MHTGAKVFETLLVLRLRKGAFPAPEFGGQGLLVGIEIHGAVSVTESDYWRLDPKQGLFNLSRCYRRLKKRPNWFPMDSTGSVIER